MDWNERIFQVTGDDGLVRRGILTEARNGGPVAAILLPAGLKDRVGPHRLYVNLARELASRGISTLRFDPAGIGESDGMLETAFNGRHYRAIQQGLYVEDTLLAMQALGETCGAERFVLAGLCGGAISAQLVAARAPSRVAGVVSLSAVAVLDEERPGAAKATRNETVSNARSYARKMFSWQAWRRLLGGEAGLGNVFRTLGNLFLVALEKAGLRRRRAPNENPFFFSSFNKLEQNDIPHLMIFGERDARWLAFREMVVDELLDGHMSGRGYSIHVVADANHEFHLREWQRDMLAQITGWLDTLSIPTRGSARGDPMTRAVN